MMQLSMVSVCGVRKTAAKSLANIFLKSPTFQSVHRTAERSTTTTLRIYRDSSLCHEEQTTNKKSDTRREDNNNNIINIMLALSSNQKKSKNGNGGGFESLNLSPPIFAGIKRLGYRTPTPVQRKSLPVLLTGTDAVVMARTGSEFSRTLNF